MYSNVWVRTSQFHKILIVLFKVLVLSISQTYVLIVCKVYPFSFFSFLKFNMASNSRTLESAAAVRGFHVFRKNWKPALNEQLYYLLEPGNDYDVFSIKTCKPDRTTVSHLPREISRPTKFLLDRVAEIVAEIESSHYQRSRKFSFCYLTRHYKESYASRSVQETCK